LDGPLPFRAQTWRDDDSLPCHSQDFLRAIPNTSSVSFRSDDRSRFPARFETVARAVAPRWIRIGHGHGFDDMVRAEGFELRAFLSTNFPEADPDDFFLFVSCDGYRALLSGREIFATPEGAAMMIADRINGEPPPRGYLLAPTADYFSDRAMWGLAHVVWIRQAEIES